MLTEKKCYGCQTTKTITEFGNDKRGVGGFKNYCRLCCTKRRKLHYEKNKEKELVKGKEYKAANKEKLAELSRAYRKANPEKVKEWKRNEYKRRRSIKKNIVEDSISRAINKRVKFNRQFGHWEEILGYSVEQLMLHLESKFKPEMNWDNYGSYWHIDHVKPKSWFEYDALDSEAFKQCWALDNLQPLEASLNCSKQNRYEG